MEPSLLSLLQNILPPFHCPLLYLPVKPGDAVVFALVQWFEEKA